MYLKINAWDTSICPKSCHMSELQYGVYHGTTKGGHSGPFGGLVQFPRRNHVHCVANYLGSKILSYMQSSCWCREGLEPRVWGSGLRACQKDINTLEIYVYE